MSYLSLMVVASVLWPLWGSVALAQGRTTYSAFDQVPSRFQSRDLTAGAKGLGDICYSRGVMPEGSVCNPAFLGDVRENSLIARIYLGNGYPAISTAHHFLFEPVSREFLQSMFNEKSSIGVDGQVGLLFTTKYFSAGFSPYRIQYSSEVHNPNFAIFSLHAMLERQLFFSGGVPLDRLIDGMSGEWGRVSVGAKLSLLDRRYLHSSFSFFQALSEEPTQFAPVKTQNALFLEPSIGWVRSDGPWTLRASVAGTHLGAAWPKDPLFAEDPDIAAGFGVERSLGYGTYKLGLDIVELFNSQELLDRFRVGTSYQIGMVEPMVGLNSSAFSLGAIFAFELLQASVIYEYVSDRFGGYSSDSRISTELGVRL